MCACVCVCVRVCACVRAFVYVRALRACVRARQVLPSPFAGRLINSVQVPDQKPPPHTHPFTEELSESFVRLPGRTFPVSAVRVGCPSRRVSQ